MPVHRRSHVLGKQEQEGCVCAGMRVLMSPWPSPAPGDSGNAGGRALLLASSLKRASALLLQDVDFQGPSVTLVTSGDVPASFNDQASSLKVVRS
jgi:hypothetical protein